MVTKSRILGLAFDAAAAGMKDVYRPRHQSKRRCDSPEPIAALRGRVKAV